MKKGEFVEIDPQEIRALRAEKDEAINIDAFTPPDEVQSIYLSGKTFYLVRRGRQARSRTHCCTRSCRKRIGRGM